MITLVSVGDRVSQGTHTLHARFRQAVHFQGSTGLTFLVDERTGAGPVNIVIHDGDPGSIENLTIEDDSLFLNGKSFDIDDQHIFCSAIGALKMPGTHFRRNLALLKECILASAHHMSLAFLLEAGREGAFRGGFELEFVRRIHAGVEKLFSGDHTGGTALIRGCGFGLTPSGDDFLAGVLIALNVLQKFDGRCRANMIDTIFLACGKGSPLSDTFLALAREGRVNERMKQLISALMNGDVPRIRRNATLVLDQGASSGADLATGFLITLNREGVNGATHDN